MVAVVHVGVRVVMPHVHVMHVAVGRAHLRCQRIVPGLGRSRGWGRASLMQTVSWPRIGICCCKGAMGCSNLEVRMNTPQTGRWRGLVRAGPKGSWEITPLAWESWAVWEDRKHVIYLRYSSGIDLPLLVQLCFTNKWITAHFFSLQRGISWYRG